MSILGICGLQAIGDDYRHIASLTFYPGICRAENFSTAEETQYHSSSISFYVSTYVQVRFNPSSFSPCLLHLTPPRTHHHTTPSVFYKVYFLLLENLFVPFHSTTNLCVPSIPFLSACAPVLVYGAQLRPTDRLYKKNVCI